MSILGMNLRIKIKISLPYGTPRISKKIKSTTLLVVYIYQSHILQLDALENHEKTYNWVMRPVVVSHVTISGFQVQGGMSEV